jgi:serine/threonine protein kinase
MPLFEGQQIGPYKIVAQLGQGGMASVYKAYHAKLDRYVAIKVMHQAFLEDPNFHARFEREAQIVAKLEHPNIIPVYDYSEFEGQPYLVMKYVEGRTLKNILSRGQPSLDETLRIMAPIASALTYAHARGVLHRDIKPSNIVIDNDEIPYLTDFGLARIAQAGESTMSQDVILGTPQYISPEQARGERNLDSRTDLYSLGVILYEMAVGRVPFNADTPYAIVHDHIYSELPKPTSINETITPAMESVLLKALAKEPADRFATANEMMDAFRAAIGGVSVAAPAPRPVTPMTPPPTAPRGPGPRPMDDSPTITDNLPMRDAEPGRDYRGRDRERRRGPTVTIPSPMPPRPPGAPRPRGYVETDLDFGEIGRRIREGIGDGSNIVSNIASSIEEAVKNHESGISEEERIRRRIEKRYKEKRGLQIHFTVYVMVNAFLWIIWAFANQGLAQLVNDPDFTKMSVLPWPLIVMFGWGIGLVAHFIEYYGKYGAGAERREREIQREIERQMGYQSASMEKPKRSPEEARYRLTDDGEIEEVVDEDGSIQQKRKRG